MRTPYEIDFRFLTLTRGKESESESESGEGTPYCVRWPSLLLRSHFLRLTPSQLQPFCRTLFALLVYFFSEPFVLVLVRGRFFKPFCSALNSF